MFANLGRSTLPQTVAALAVGVGLWRYVVRPSLHPVPRPQQAPAPLSPPPPSPPPLPLLPLASIDDLRLLGDSTAVVLFARGLGAARAAEVAAARAAIAAAAARLSPSAPALRFYVVDDASAQVPALTLQARLGLQHETPLLVLLDRYVATERKFILGGAAASSATAAVTASSVEAFVRRFLAGGLAPDLLGQPRPPGDRSAACPQLIEVVTDSFAELVLDPARDVLLESYTRRCDACKALAPRVRMLAQLCAQHLPQLRVAAMDILDNDRDAAHLPEKWTPALRLFLRCAPGDAEAAGAWNGSRAGTGTGEGGRRKRSVLLSYGGDEGGPSSAPPPSPSSSPSSTVAGVPAPHAPPSPAASSSSPARVVLPTLPEMLAFVETSSGGRLAPSSALRALADAAEHEAAQLEAAYDAALGFARLHAAFALLLDDREAAGAPRDDAARAAADELAHLAAESHGYIAREAAVGGLAPAMRRLDAVAAHVERHGISAALRAAAGQAEAAAEASMLLAAHGQ